MLDHIETIDELGDLEDVEPTSHVVAVENALRADEPRPSLPREVALASAPDAALGRLPRPEPGRRERRMSELLELTAAQAAEQVRTGELEPRGAVERLPRARRRRRAQRLHLGRRRRARPPSTARRRSAGVPVAVKDLFATEGIPSQAGSKILEDYRPPYTATAVERLDRRRRAAARQDQPGRVRDGLLHRALRLRPDAEPVGPRARARRLLGRLGRRRRRRHSRRGRSAPTPAARSASPPRCAASSA